MLMRAPAAPTITPQYRSIKPLVPGLNPGDANPFTQGDSHTGSDVPPIVPPEVPRYNDPARAAVEDPTTGNPMTTQTVDPAMSGPNAFKGSNAADTGTDTGLLPQDQPPATNTPVATPARPPQDAIGTIVSRARAAAQTAQTNALPSDVPPGTDIPASSETGLRGDVYAPGNDPRLSSAQSATDAAAAAVQGTDRNAIQAGQEAKYRDIYGTGQVSAPSVDPNVQFKSINTNVAKGPAVGTDESARTTGYGTAQDAALAGLGGPNRTDLAKQTLADFETQGGIDLANKFRTVGRTSAKFGRMGLGDVNSELGSIQGDYNRSLLQKRNELASGVAEGDINDRYKTVAATSGLRSQEAGLDAARQAAARTERAYGTAIDTGNVDRAGQQQALEQSLAQANKARQIGERDTQLGVATGNADRSFARTNAALGVATGQTGARIGDASTKLNAARTLEDQIAAQGASNRGEMRTERGYQTGQAQQSIENRLAERKQQQAEKDARLRQAMAQAQAGG